MNNLYKLLRFVKPYWKRSAAALFFLITVVFLDLAIPRLVQEIIDEGIFKNQMETVTSTMLLMLGISVVSTLFSIANNTLSVQVGEGVARDLRRAVFTKVQSLSFGNLDRLQTGQLIVRLTSDITILQRVTRMIIRIGTRAPLLMVGSIILMFNTNIQLSLTMLPLVLVMSIILVLFVGRVTPLFLKLQKKLDNLNTVLQENIAGVRVIKAFVRANHENERFEDVNEAYTETSVRVTQITAMLFPMLTLLINIGIVIVIWAGGIQAIEGTLTVGEIVAYTNYLMTTMTPIMIMAMLSHVLAMGTASAERVNEVLDDTPEVLEAPDAISLPEDVRAHIVFEDVGFHYNGASNEPVLCDINLTAEPGQTVAILGATGSGKSTLINLIPRFYDVATGRITLDGIDIRDLRLDSLLSQIGIALQETVLFSGSVRENIRYGKPEASEEEVTSAAMAAQAHDFIMELPDDYDTQVKQRGVNLSGGQKQRIAIARAILLKPKILILDDTTSAVDVETENKIQAALDEIMEGRTSFVIAQRISTVLNADKIIVLDRGRIAASGTHNQLMKTSPIYKEIYDSQLGEGERLSPTIEPDAFQGGSNE